MGFDRGVFGRVDLAALYTAATSIFLYLLDRRLTLEWVDDYKLYPPGRKGAGQERVACQRCLQYKGFAWCQLLCCWLLRIYMGDLDRAVLHGCMLCVD